VAANWCARARKEKLGEAAASAATVTRGYVCNELHDVWDLVRLSPLPWVRPHTAKPLRVASTLPGGEPGRRGLSSLFA
jgi:hypothetical protein